MFTDEYLSNHEKYDIIDAIYNNQLNGKLKQYKIVAVDHSHGKVFYKVTTDFITIDAKNNTIENTYNLAFEFSPFSIINVKLHSVEPINDNTHTHNDEHVH